MVYHTACTHMVHGVRPNWPRERYPEMYQVQSGLALRVAAEHDKLSWDSLPRLVTVPPVGALGCECRTQRAEQSEPAVGFQHDSDLISY